MQYLQEQLPVVPGKTRNAKIDCYSFKNLPIYSLGRQSLLRLFGSYKLSHSEPDRIGRTNFLALRKLLCTKQKMKTGLSSYFARLRDAGKIIIRMINHLSEFEGISGIGLSKNDNNCIENDCNYLLEQWHTVYQFLQYEYSYHHLQVSSTCCLHCCT